MWIKRPATAVVALAVMFTWGCSAPEATPSPSPSSSSVPTARPPSASPTPSATDLAISDATGLVRRYYATMNHLRQDASQPLSLLAMVAVSAEHDAQRLLLKKERRAGLHQTGETKVAELKVQSVNLDNSDPKSGRVPVVFVDVCWDVTDVDIVDKDGKSVVSTSRPNTGWVRHTVANYQRKSNPRDGWRIASSQDIESPPCAAS